MGERTRLYSKLAQLKRQERKHNTVTLLGSSHYLAEAKNTYINHFGITINIYTQNISVRK
jgi:hypothetical protein